MKKAVYALLLVGFCFLWGCETPPNTDGTSAVNLTDQASPNVDDTAIASAVEAALSREGLLANNNINVVSRQGEVSLSGRVPNANTYLRAISVARSVPGVVPPVKAVDLVYP